MWTAKRRSYRDLLRRKRESLWMAKVDAERSLPHQLWRSVDALLVCSHVPPSQDIGATAFHRFFEAKVAGVRASTADAPPLSFTPAHTGCELRVFRPVTTTNVIRAVQALPDKQCASDPFSTRVLKSSVDILAPFLTELFNRSLSAGAVNASRLLLPDLQSAYRAHHSTETAVVKVLADIPKALDGGDLAMLTLLDLSAAFDTVDHGILLHRLETLYGL